MAFQFLALGQEELAPYPPQQKDLVVEMTHGVMLAGLQAIIDPPRPEGYARS
jgi:hypothetical protein